LASAIARTCGEGCTGTAAANPAIIERLPTSTAGNKTGRIEKLPLLGSARFTECKALWRIGQAGHLSYFVAVETTTNLTDFTALRSASSSRSL
jgi:hypothetical protein